MTMTNKRIATRVVRELTPAETARLAEARAEACEARDEILREGRSRKMAWTAMRREVEKVVAALKSERERLGLSLADVEAASGLKRSALSRLENDPNANPTLLTLQRYALALQMSLSASVDTI